MLILLPIFTCKYWKGMQCYYYCQYLHANIGKEWDATIYCQYLHADIGQEWNATSFANIYMQTLERNGMLLLLPIFTRKY